MSHLPFQVSECEIAPGCTEIRVEGELDLAVADQLAALIARSDAGQTLMLINLEGCQFIDSSGIAVIVRAQRERANNGGGRIVIHSPTAQVLRVLTVTGLTDNGFVFYSEDEALAESAVER